MDFKSFRKSFHRQDAPKAEREETLREKAREYAGKSDDELLSEILKNVRQGRESGTFSDAGLEQFRDRVAPMLNQEQRERLQSVIDLIKKG